MDLGLGLGVKRVNCHYPGSYERDKYMMNKKSTTEGSPTT
jgi:hypothetical protein